MTMVTLNGKAFPHEESMTVRTLLSALQANPGKLVVEVNGTIVPLEAYDETPVNPGDTIEIVHFVGGG